MENTTLHKAFSADVTIEEGERAVIAEVSTIAVDRDGDVLASMGCRTKDYELNPVLMLQHDYWTLPVGKCVSIQRAASEVTAKFVFADKPTDFPQDQEWVPDTLFSLYKQGVLRGFSVGFIPLESRPAHDKDIATYGANCRRVITKWNLLEVSVVSIPCNQEAVALAVSKGFCSEKTAKALFGETKAVEKAAEPDPAKPPAPKMGTCSVCGNSFALPDMIDDGDGGFCCSLCAAKPAENAPEPKSVIAAVDLPAESTPDAPPMFIRSISDPYATREAAIPLETKVRKVLVRKVAKLQGRIYINE